MSLMLLRLFFGFALVAAEAQTGDYERGLALLKEQRYTAAATTLEHAAALEPAKLEIAIALAAAYAGKGDLDKAQRILTDAATSHPDSASAQFELGNLYAQRKLFAKVRRPARNSPGSESRTGTAALVKALLTPASGGMACASSHSPKIHPDAFDTHYLRGAGERGTGEYEHAASDLRLSSLIRITQYRIRVRLGAGAIEPAAGSARASGVRAVQTENRKRSTRNFSLPKCCAN